MAFQGNLEIVSIQKYEKGMEEGYMYSSEALVTLRHAPTLEIAQDRLRIATGHKDIEIVYIYETKKTLEKGYILMPFVWSMPDETDGAIRHMVQIEPGDYIVFDKSGKKWAIKEHDLLKIYQLTLPEQQSKKTPSIEAAFSYHAPKDGQPQRYTSLREHAKNLAYLIEVFCPASRERSLAMTKLEEAVMWANASIARNE